MPGTEPPRKRGERDETNASLDAERQKTDRELRTRSAGIEEDSDEQVSRARARAKVVLIGARTRADARIDTSSAGDEVHDAIEDERRAEDVALTAEYDAADVGLRGEREGRQRALSQLLALERAETDRTLTLERARADLAVATRDDFLAMVSHDLRTMLGGIAMNAAMIVRDAPDDDVGHKMLRRGDSVSRLTARMGRLVGDLLDIVSIEAGKLEVVPEARDAARLLRDATELFEPSAAARGIALETRFEREALLGEFDYDRVLQVLGNLVSNAIRFTEAGGRITICVERLGPDVHFSVTDTGAGISADEIEAVFERFHQASRTGRVGLGLGLYISRAIVEAHGGRIWAESTIGEGSTFHFTLPGASARRPADEPVTPPGDAR